MEINLALKKLFSLHQFGIKLGLESTLQLLNMIGNPHQKLKCFHVAGSNGKGSTCSFIASILMEMGFKVGLYTSPHFVKFNERIRVNGETISDDYVANFISQLDSYIDLQSPTFFELTTALAFKYFAEQKVDFAVIETGLGGRLDSTNVINPLVSVITSISLDHTAILGDTLEKIAFEKAGIIKEGIPTILGKLPERAEGTIVKIANERRSQVYSLHHFAMHKESSVVIESGTGNFHLYTTPLKGEHQLINSAMAAKAILETLEVQNLVLISRGIRNVIRNSGIQGRYEILSKKPRIILDSAHNSEGVVSFLKEFHKEQHCYDNRYLIFGSMSDKDYPEMLRLLKPFFSQILITKVEIDRAAGIDELQDALGTIGVSGKVLANPIDFISEFLQKNSNDCLAVVWEVCTCLAK